MDPLMTLLKSEVYTTTTFRSWTDGPKCIIDTMNLADTLNLDGVSSVMTAPSELALRTELDGFLHNDVSTFYLLNDVDAARLAMSIRPDLDIRLVMVDNA